MTTRQWQHPQSGVTLNITFEHNAQGVIVYTDVRVVDGTYSSVGPNLVDFLDSLYTEALPWPNFSVTPFLAELQEEL